MASTTLREELLGQLERLHTTDCHSHTILERDYQKLGGLDLFSLMSYFAREVQSVGGDEAAKALASGPDDQRWETLKAILARARNVSYWRHNLVVYRHLFGFADPELDDSNWRSLNQAIKSRTTQPGWYRHLTRDLCGLRTQVRNIPWFEDWEPAYFTAVLRMEEALNLHDPATRQRLEEHTGVQIADLPTLKRALATLTEDYVRRGARGIKLAHAYSRTLHSEPVSPTVAGRILAKALRGKPLRADELKRLQDHVIFFLADLADELDLVFQIHTGVQTTWGNIPNSDPLLLIPLLESHRGVRFDLFHAGYPYSRQLGMLGKHYPNVWLNMCWMYVISTEASRRVLAEWLDLVPAYRILGFGSDVPYPEFVYGHLLIARRCLADVLAEKVERDFLSEECALDLARMLLQDNPAELYRL